MNRPDGLHFSYKRYLINTLRESWILGESQSDIWQKREEREKREGKNRVGLIRDIRILGKFPSLKIGANRKEGS